jgi:hypothetical protein
MKNICLTIFAYLFINTLPAQTYFDRLYGEEGGLFPDLSEGRAHQLPDSTYLFSYYSSDFFLDEAIIHINHLDQNGELLTNFQLHEPGFSLFVKECIPIDDQHFLMLGAKSPAYSNQMGIMLIKYDAGFAPVWSKTFYDGENYLWGSDIYPTPDGGFLIAGRTWLYHPDTGAFIDAQILVIRTDSSGEELWRRTYGSPNLWERVSGIASTDDGGFLLAGRSQQPWSAGDFQAMILKINHLGHQQWERKIGLGNRLEVFSGIIRTMDGNYALVGQIAKRSTDGFSILYGRQWLVKVSPTGMVLWEQLYPEASSGTWFQDLVELDDGSIVAAGAHKGQLPGSSQAGFILKTTAEGETVWSHTYDRNPNHIDLFYSINTTLDGGFVLTGFGRDSAGSSQDAWILKVDSLGCREPCITPTAVQEPLPVQYEGFQLWPNPTQGPLWAQWAQPLPAGRHRLLVYDAAGRLVRQATLAPGATTVEQDLSELPAGVYFIVWEAQEQGRVVRRVVKVE